MEAVDAVSDHVILPADVDVSDTLVAVEELDAAGAVAEPDPAGLFQFDTGALGDADAVPAGIDAHAELAAEVEADLALAVQPDASLKGPAAIVNLDAVLAVLGPLTLDVQADVHSSTRLPRNCVSYNRL